MHWIQYQGEEGWGQRSYIIVDQAVNLCYVVLSSHATNKLLTVRVWTEDHHLDKKKKKKLVGKGGISSTIIV